MILSIEVKKTAGNTIGEKDEQRYGGRIKNKTFMQIALYQRNYSALKTTAGAIYTCDILKRTWKQMILQPFNKNQMTARYLYRYQIDHIKPAGAY